MQAWGQTSEHWLHMMQFSGIHFGTLTAMPLFSYLVVPVGTKPLGSNVVTGSASPFCVAMGWMTSLKYSFSATFAGSAPVVASAQEAG